ncbi:DUF5133 domain-containing protein [Streptomyces sp. HC44]|uniref:DUF5133 domain-containing protein n=1 Tax=Streptomyces scabichelini TaxID=2711217 RepID=A0A6G4V5X7_9ACTN|nr:DUF5133 domain-containing protein [Streptomyces scabichelini]NGO09244.1 DUF5133 domain-containing protein [Streptomyces scabichelini]
MLLPAKAEVARHLERYRAWERLMLAAPTDRAARDNFEDTGYTLCVLMGARCAREAADAAERYLCADLTAYFGIRNGGTIRRGIGRTGRRSGGRGGRKSGTQPAQLAAAPAR